MIIPKQPRLLHPKKKDAEIGAGATLVKESKTSSTLLMCDEKLQLNSLYYAWVAMIFSIIIWFKFGTTSSSGELGNTSNYYRIILVLFAGVFAAHNILKNSHRIKKALILPIILLLLYGFVALLSSLLVPKNSFYTMWKSIEIIIDVMAIIGIIAYTQSINGPLNAFKWLMAYNTMMLAFIVGGALVDPTEAFRPSRGIIPYFLQGAFPVSNPNSVGFISVQLVIHNIAIYCRTDSTKQKLIASIIAITSFVTLILAQSRTSTAGLVAGLILYLYLDNKKGYATAAIIGGAVIMLFTSGSEIVTSYLQRGQSEELVTSLSGRTHGWSAAWEMFKQSPWVGHGFAAAARTEILGAHGASTLHGALFDVMVGTGLAGLLPWSLAILITLKTMAILTIKLSKWAKTRYQRSIHAEFAAMTAILVIRSATSSGTAMHEHAFMLLLCIIAYSSMVKREIAK